MPTGWPHHSKDAVREPNEFGSNPKKDDGNTRAVADTHTNTFLTVNPKQILCPRVAISAVDGACRGVA